MGKINVGGQALIEGIMMKSPASTAMAVRTPDRSIDVEYINFKSITDKYKFLKFPVIRGVVNFIESMLQGYKTLMLSAEKSGMTDLEEEKTKNSDKQSGIEDEKVEENEKGVKKEKSKKEEILISAVMVIGTVLGVFLSLFLFLYIPALIFDGIKFITGGTVSDKIRPLFEGVLKIAIFVGYLAAVSLMNDIKRVFMYHGAEHKSIFCYEHGLELTVENVRKQKRFHPRCGTSFMILMLIVSIFFSFLIVTFFPGITDYRILWVLIKILLIPLTCGFGYELIRFCGKHNNFVTKVISAPGMWVQRLTTKEPEDDMIEVAIAALSAVLEDKNI